jgi:transcriptional regulator with XRE-family HTH domain
VVDNRPLARAIGSRIRSARQQSGLSQRELAAGRYTSSYISALENGLAKPSMAALSFLADRLRCSISDLVGDQRSDAQTVGMRLEADLRLASGDWQRALDLYSDLLEQTSDDTGRAEVQRGAAEALYRLGRHTDAITVASQSVALFKRLGRQVDVSRLLGRIRSLPSRECRRGGKHPSVRPGACSRRVGTAT